MKCKIGLVCFLFSMQVFAWDSPSEAATAFVEFDMSGGRVFEEKRPELLEKYLVADPLEKHVPGVEFGWSTKPDAPVYIGVNIIESFSVTKVDCKEEMRCTVSITGKSPITKLAVAEWNRSLGSKCHSCYVRYPQMEINDGRDEDVLFGFDVLKTAAGWKVIDFDVPFVSFETYKIMVYSGLGN